MKLMCLILSLILLGSLNFTVVSEQNRKGHTHRSIRIAHDASSVQCKGKTKAGNQCKNKTNNESGYCHLHDRQKPVGGPVKVEKGDVELRCSGITKAGNQCKRFTKNVNGRCYQHQEN
jgi:hypothetical protein